jgi:hypothetical protein
MGAKERYVIAWTSKLSARALIVPAVMLLTMTAAGCGTGSRSVAGKVAVNNLPITSGGVTFVPDAEKGNTSTAAAFGSIQDDGTYEMTTAGKAGVAPGWYKVVVVAHQSPDPRNLYAKPRSAVNSRYASAATSDLRIEVTSGGSYDLALAGP